MLLFKRFYFRLVSELCIHRAYQILHRICHEKYWSYFHIASSFDDFIYQYNAHLSVFGCFSEVKWMINMSCIALAIFQPTPDTVHVIQTRQYFSQYNDSKKDDIAMNRLGVVQRPCQYLLWIYVTLSPFVISKSAVTSDALKTSSEMACYNLLRDPYFWEKLKFIRILWKSLQIGITASFFKKNYWYACLDFVYGIYFFGIKKFCQIAEYHDAIYPFQLVGTSIVRHLARQGNLFW